MESIKFASIENNGIRFAPVLPADWGRVAIKNIAYRNQVMEIRLFGQGTIIKEFRLDGKTLPNPFLSGDLTGSHLIEITLADH